MRTEPLGGWKRTHSCGALRAADAGQTVTLMGWVFRRRDHGGLIFVDLRDRDGHHPVRLQSGERRRGARQGPSRCAASSSWPCAARWPRARRAPRTRRSPTGAVEVRVSEIKILNDCRPLPFQLDVEGEADVDETLRLKYRYLDMRRPAVLHAFQIRDLLCRAVRDYLHAHGFLEVETPFLTRSTPGGRARLPRAEPAPARAPSTRCRSRPSSSSSS